MSKFIIGVTKGIAKVYPYGQGSEVSKVLKESEALLCQVPVGDHVEPVATDPNKPVAADPKIAQSTKDLLKGMADEDKAAPAAGVANDEPPSSRTGTILVAVTEGKVTVRTYHETEFSEQVVEQGASASVDVTESNRITVAVYEAAPVVDPRKDK